MSNVKSDQLFVINNFYEGNLAISEEKITKKYSDIEPLKFLYLSNFYEGKGFEYLLKALIELEKEILFSIEVTFAGGFENEKEFKEFLFQIKNYNQINYIGIIKGVKKQEILENSHVLIFPSYIEEGQGISIIEAYVNGMCVITTGISGISDIFTNEINGYQFKPKSSKSIQDAIIKTINEKEKLINIGKANYFQAIEKYDKSIFDEKIKKTIK